MSSQGLHIKTAQFVDHVPFTLGDGYVVLSGIAQNEHKGTDRLGDSVRSILCLTCRESFRHSPSIL